MIGATVAAVPGDGALWSNLGIRLLERGGNAEAADAFRRSVALVPNRSAAWLGLSLASLRLGALDEAEESASRAVALNPELAMARMVLAECALRKGAPCRTLTLLQRVPFEEPSEIVARDRLVDLARKGCPGGG